MRTILILLALAFNGCRKAESTSAPKHVERMLYCGAGIQAAASEVKTAFEADNPDIKLAITYAGSGRLPGQLGASRTGDLFMPGSSCYIDEAIAKKWADSLTRRKLAYFIPVIMV